MDTILHANTFFFISSIGFIITFLLLAIVLLYLVSVLRKANRIAKGLEQNAEAIGEDAREFILDIRNSPVLAFLFGRKRS